MNPQRKPEGRTLRLTAGLASLFWVVTVLAGCGGGKAESDADLPELTLDIRRTELTMRAMRQAYLADSVNLKPEQAFERYAAADKGFWADFLFDDTGYGRSAVASLVAGFSADKYTAVLLDSVMAVYPENYDFASKLALPLRRLKKIFPDLRVPPIRTYLSGFAEPGIQTMDPSFLSDHYLGLGLHYHLRSDFPFYPPDIPRYVRRRLAPEYLSTRVLNDFLDKRQVAVEAISFARGGREAQPRLIDYVVNGGVRHAIVDRCLSEVADSVWLGYTAEQMAWLERNEATVYNALAPLLFEQDYFKFRSWVGEAPGTPRLAADAPARLAQWMGWRAIRNYLKAHPDASLAELAKRHDTEALFRETGYRPK